MTIQDIRRANLRAWVQQNGTPSKEKSYFSQVLSGTSPIGERAARRLERDYRMGEGFLDASQGDTPLAPEAAPPSPWPFLTINEADVRALPASQLSALEGAIALAIAQMRLGVAVVPPPGIRPHLRNRGGLADIDSADDPFPMRIGLPSAAATEIEDAGAPAERASKMQISTRTGVVANVAPGEPHAANDKFERVPELGDVRLAAGEGIENLAEEETGTVHFRRSFLRSVGANAGKARVVYAKGNSMEPVIRDGAALLVVPNESLTLRDVASGGVYAINYDGKMIVKTVTQDRLTKRWVARSFNPAHPDISLENGVPVRVLGQVVWAGARLGNNESGHWTRS